MRARGGNRSTLGVRLAATIGPEIVALGLSIFVVIALAIAFGFPTPDADGRSAAPATAHVLLDQARVDQPAPRRRT